MIARWVLLLAALGLLLAACESRQQTVAAKPAPATPTEPGLIVLPPDSPKLQQIKVEAVQTANVPTDEVVAPGKVDVNPNRVSRVLLPVPGRITGVMAQLGDLVQKGQPVATLESPDADAAIAAYRQANAQVSGTRAAQAKAQADVDRTQDLFEHRAIAKKEVINAESVLAETKAAAEQAQAARQQALSRLEILGLKPEEFRQQVVIRAPLAGKVLEIHAAAGEYRADTTQPLMTIADLSVVWMSSDVPEIAIRLIKPGEPVDIELVAYPGQVFHGRVARLADTVDPQTRTVKVLIELPNPGGRLRPEMFGRIRHVEPGRRMPVVPESAVLQEAGRSAVFVEQKPGVFRQTPVTVGKPVGDRIPILSGVQPGDRVVVDGALLLKGT